MREGTMTDKDTAADDKTDEGILGVALERYEQAQGSWAMNIDLARQDIRFANGNSDNGWQWPEAIRNARFRDQRPCLTINQLPQFIRQITNDMRQNRPAIKYRAVDSKGDPLLAKVAQGIARHVMTRSSAAQAMDLAAENQVTCGFGYWRIVTEYAENEGFNQEIRVLPVWDVLSVMLDPLYTMPDASDAEWGFVTERISRKEYKRRYPNDEIMPFDRGAGANYQDWVGDDSVRLADYYYKQHETKKLYQLRDGSVTDTPPVPEAVLKSRDVDVVTVKWVTMNGQKILEKRDWPGSHIPIIPVFGRSFMVDGIRYYTGIIRNSKDPQRNYNYWNSAATELLSLTQKAPYIGAAGQFEGHEAKWSSGNTTSYPYLEYNPITISGQPAPPPQRQPFAGVPTGIIDQLERSRQDMKATSGIYQAALGQQGNEVSGRAIAARARESDNSTFDFADAQARAIALTGKILLEIVPAVYDTQRIVRMVDDNDTEMVAEINGPNLPVALMKSAAYDVICDVGPSYATKRAEAAESLMTFVKQIPQVGQVAGDLIARNMDWPGADQLADRLKLMLPPQIQAAANSKTPELTAMQQQMQQQDQEAKQAVAHVQQLAQQKISELAQEVEALQSKLNDKGGENEARMRELDLREIELMLKHKESSSKIALDADSRIAELRQKRDEARERYATQRGIATDQIDADLTIAAMNARSRAAQPQGTMQ